MDNTNDAAIASSTTGTSTVGADKTNDWVVASLMSPQSNFADFFQKGVTPDNTQLQDKAYYENNDQIKKIFTDSKTGDFKQTDFDKFYDISVATYNQFSNKAFNQNLINNAPTYFADQIHKPQNVNTLTQQAFIAQVSNPFQKKTGFDGFNVVSDPTLSVRQLAQQSEVQDSTTGKGLGWTPNDDSKSGLFDFWFTPTVALAQYDEDGTHYDPMEGAQVKHHKGDYKSNSQGNFYYETLGDKESYGKQILSVWDTNTTDGSFANKFDFMASDGLSKSLGGSIVKTAAQILPYFIPGVGEAYGAMQIGLSLGEALPALAKGISGIFLNDAQKDTSYFKALNETEGFFKRFSSGSSDSSKTSSFNSENILQMVADTYGMLYLQRGIAAIPQSIGASSKEAKMLKEASDTFGPEVEQLFSGNLENAGLSASAAGKDAQGVREAKDLILQQLASRSPELSKIYENSTKWTNMATMGMSTAYLSATMSTGIADKAKELGLDERDTGALLLGSMIGLGAFISKVDIGHWALQGMGLDDISLAINQVIKDEGGALKTSFDGIDLAIKEKAAAGANTGELNVSRLNRVFNVAKDFGAGIASKMADPRSYIGKAIAEGLVMNSQDAIQDGLKVGYNALNALGLTSTNDKAKSFDFTPQDMFQRYAMSFFGGALGGVMFLAHDQLNAKFGKVMPEEQKKDMFYLVRNEYKDQLLDAIEKQQKKGMLGNSAVSPLIYDTQHNITGDVLYKPAPSADQSQNNIIGSLLKSQVQYLDRIIRQENIPSDVEVENAYQQRYDTAIDLKLNTAIRDDVQKLSTEIIDKVNEIKSITPPGKDATDFDTNKYKNEVNKLNSELLSSKEELRKITDGEKYTQYYGDALFNMNSNLNSPFGVKNKNDLAIATYDKPFWELDDVQKQDVNDKYGIFTYYDKRQQLRLGKELFDKVHDEVNKWIPTLAGYADQKQGYFNTYVDVNDTMAKLMVSPDNVDQINTKNAALDSFVSDREGEGDIDYLLRVVDSQKYIHPEITQKLLDTFAEMKANNFLVQNGTTVRGAFNHVLDAMGAGHIVDDIDQSFDIPDYLNLDKLDDLHVGNVDETINSVKKDLIDNKNELDQLFPDPDSIPTINKALDSLKSYLKEINPEFSEFNDKAELLSAKIKSKENSPLYDLLKKSIVNSEGASLTNVLDVLQSEFKLLSEKEDASKYVIDNHIRFDQLSQVRDSIAKLKASLNASANFTYKDEPFGYNPAINHVKEKMGDKDLLNVLSLDQFQTLHKELSLLQGKTDFLLNLSRINEGNKIKNMKLTSGVMRALFVDSIGPKSEVFSILENAGVEMAGITNAYGEASNLNNWVSSIRDSDNKIPLPSKDDALTALEKETGTIERSIYDAINKNPQLKHELLEKIQQGFDLSKLVTSYENKTNFSHTAKSVTYYDAYMYLNMIANVDGGEFLNDFRGDNKVDGRYDIEKSEYAPFFGQEYALKLAYWTMQSQSSEVNTINIAMNRLAIPQELKTDEEKRIFSDNLYKTLFNTIFINGIPGSGKTTGILNYLTRIAEKYNYKIAAYGPHEEQGQKLKESLTEAKNVVNTDMHVKSLLRSIMPDGLYDKISLSLENREWDTNTIDRDNPNNAFKSRKYVMLEKMKNGEAYDMRLNPTHPEIASFFNGEGLSSINVDGNNVNMILIDEATHLSAIDLQILDTAIKIHNDKNANKIGLYLTGDSEQRGATLEVVKGSSVNVNLNMFKVFKTPVLSESLRTGYNVKSKNIDVIRAYRQLYDNILKTSPVPTLSADLKNFVAKEEINLQYTEENEDLIGDKLIKGIDKVELDKLLKSAPITTGSDKPGKIGIIVSDLDGDLVKLVKGYDDWESKFDIKTPDKVQGLEYDYVAIDVNPSVIEGGSPYSAIRALEMLYTMTTRSKKGSLVKDNIVQGLTLKSSDKDVFAVKTQIDPNIINDYKKFRLDSINYILNELGTSKYNTEGKASVPPAPGVPPVSISVKPTVLKSRNFVTTDAEDDRFLSLVLNAGVSENPDASIDSAGQEQAYQYSDQKLLTYPFHSRWQAMTDKNSRITTVEKDDADISLFYKILNPSGEIKGKLVTDDFVQAADNNLRIFKNALYNYTNYRANPENTLSLEDYFRRYTSLHDDLLDAIDFKNIKIGVESKYWKPNSDSNKALPPRKEAAGGVAHFLVAKLALNPRAESSELLTSGEITLAAFPNQSNPAVSKIKSVNDTINLLNDRFERAKVAEGGDVNFRHFAELKSGVKNEDVLQPTSNMIIKPGEQVGLDEAKTNNPHLKVSPVHIIANAKMFDQGEDANVDIAIKNLLGNPTDPDGRVNKFQNGLIGRPVIFVTYDVTKSEATLAQDYQAQFIDSVRNPDKANRTTQDTIKMIPLNTKGLPFSEWVQKNMDIAFKTNKETDLDSKVQKLSYGNKFLAARILNSIYNTGIVHIDGLVGKGNFEAVRRSLRLDPKIYTDDVIKDMSSKTKTMMSNVLQILGTTSSEITITKPKGNTLHGIAKAYYDDIKQAGNDPLPKAAGHFYTKQFLGALASTTKSDGYLADNAVLKTLQDADGNSMYLEFKHSEPFGVMIALRAAIEGGKWNTVSGIKSHIAMFPAESVMGKEAFYKYLDAIVGKEFVDGLYINPVIRKATNENELPDGLLAYPAGNPDRHFTIDAKITEFNSLFDVNNLELRNDYEVSSERKSLETNFTGLINDYRNSLAQALGLNLGTDINNKIKTQIRDYSSSIINHPDSSVIENALSNEGATINDLSTKIKTIIDSSLPKNKVTPTKDGFNIIKSATIITDTGITLDSIPFEDAKNDYVRDIAKQMNIPEDHLSVTDSGMSVDNPIKYVVTNARNGEEIAKFVFKEGEFTNLVKNTPEEHLGVVKDGSLLALHGLSDELLNSVHDFIKQDVIDFYGHIGEVSSKGTTTDVDLDTQLKLGSKYLMIAASLRNNNKTKLLETFNETYKEFIENYRC